MDSRNWYYRQLVTQAELDDAFGDVEVADRNIVKDAIGYGFLVSSTYPATVEENTVPDLQVKVNELLGYDQYGRRIENLRSGYQGGSDLGTPPQVVNMAVDEVAASTSVGSPGNEKTVSIFVEFERHTSDPRIDGNLIPLNFVLDESVKYNVVQSAEAALGGSVPPPLRSDQLLLCDVVLVYSQTTIVNANIDQTRREGFTFSFVHGPSHLELGSDPIPSATTINGGLLSSTDKTKLDGIDFTDSGISALFKNRGRMVQIADVTIPAANNVLITTEMAGKDAGGSDTKEGVVTQTGNPTNRAILLDANGDSFLDGTSNLVFGEVTVDNETTPTSWTLSFYSNIAGTKTAFDMTPYAGGGAVVQVWVHEKFTLANEPTDAEAAFIPSDQVAGIIPDATASIKGKVNIISDGSTTSSTGALGTQDGRVGAVKGRANAGTVSGFEQIIRLINGSGISISLVESGGELQFTIANSATAFPGYYGSAPPVDSGAGGAGIDNAVSRGDHYHPLSGSYRVASAFSSTGALGPAGHTVVTGMVSPRMLIAIAGGGPWGNPGGPATSVGVAIDNGSGTSQAALEIAGGGNALHVGSVLHNGDENWAVTSWGSSIVITKGGGLSDTPAAAFFVIGSNY